MSERADKIIAKSRQRIAAVKTEVKNAAKNKSAQNNKISNRLELMVTVVARNKAEYYMDLIQSFEVNMQTMVLAHGTADAKTLRVLGLSDSEKAVILSFIQQDKIGDAMAALDEKFKTIKDGKGIAYTIPLTSVIGKLIYGFLSNNKSVVKGE